MIDDYLSTKAPSISIKINSSTKAKPYSRYINIPSNIVISITALTSKPFWKHKYEIISDWNCSPSKSVRLPKVS